MTCSSNSCYKGYKGCSPQQTVRVKMQNISLARPTHKNNYENNWRQTTIAISFSFHPLEVINQNLQWTADDQQSIVPILLQPWLTGAAAHRCRACQGPTQLTETCVISCHSLHWETEYLGFHRHLLSHWNFMQRARIRHSKSSAWLSVSLLAQSRQHSSNKKCFLC